MKKLTKLAAVLLLAVMMTMTICACGKGESGDELKGTWTRTDAFYGDIHLDFDGKGGFAWGYEVEGFTFNDDGTYEIKDGGVISMKASMWDSASEGTFTVSGSSLTIKECGALEGTYTKK